MVATNSLSIKTNNKKISLVYSRVICLGGKKKKKKNTCQINANVALSADVVFLVVMQK